MLIDLQLGKFKFAVNTKPIETTVTPMASEIGATGTQIFSGIITKDYNTKLTGSNAITEYDKMRKSDGQVQACLLTMKLPLLAADWRIEPASEDSNDIKIAEWVSKNIFDEMTITWGDTLRQILLLLDFGFSNFEKVYVEKDGMFQLKKLAPRLPTTNYKWNFDSEMNLQSWEQSVVINDQTQYRTIPIDKLVIFTWNQEGQNYEGQSILRPAWKHWYIKDSIYRIASIGVEKNAIGIPVITIPAAGTSKDLAEAKKIGLSYRAHDKAYIVLPEGFAFDVKAGDIKMEEIKKFIEHQDTQISKSMLTQFIDLGTDGKGGSYALSADRTDFFLMALKAVAKKVEDTMNRYVIQQLVDFNYQVDAYPKLVCGEIASRDKKAIAEALAALTTSGILHPDENVEEYIRSLFTLPEKPEQTPAPQPAPQAHDHNHSIKLADMKWRRTLTPWEVRVNLKEINSIFDTYEEKFKREAKAIVAGQSEKLIADVEKIINSGAWSDLRSLSVAYQGRYSAKIRDMLDELYTFGMKSVAKEIGKKGKTASKYMQTWIATKAETVAEYQANMLKVKTINAAMDAYSRNKSPKEILWAVRSSIQDFAERDLTGLASVTVNDAINEGRYDTADGFKADGSINRAQFSAILDNATCDLCEKLDGQVVDMDDPDYEAYTPPIHPNCRCIWVYIDTDDTTAEVDWKTPPSSLVEKYKL